MYSYLMKMLFFNDNHGHTSVYYRNFHMMLIKGMKFTRHLLRVLTFINPKSNHVWISILIKTHRLVRGHMEKYSIRRCWFSRLTYALQKVQSRTFIYLLKYTFLLHRSIPFWSVHSHIFFKLNAIKSLGSCN